MRTKHHLRIVAVIAPGLDDLDRFQCRHADGNNVVIQKFVPGGRGRLGTNSEITNCLNLGFALSRPRILQAAQQYGNCLSQFHRNSLSA